MDTRRCVCGTLILAEWEDCGAPRCMLRSTSLATDIPHREWRFKAIKQILPFNRIARHQTDSRVQEAALMTSRAIKQQLADENLRRLNRRMRREDALTDD